MKQEKEMNWNKKNREKRKGQKKWNKKCTMKESSEIEKKLSPLSKISFPHTKQIFIIIKNI